MKLNKKGNESYISKQLLREKFNLNTENDIVILDILDKKPYIFLERRDFKKKKDVPVTIYKIKGFKLKNDNFSVLSDTYETEIYEKEYFYNKSKFNRNILNKIKRYINQPETELSYGAIKNSFFDNNDLYVILDNKNKLKSNLYKNSFKQII